MSEKIVLTEEQREIFEAYKKLLEKVENPWIEDIKAICEIENVKDNTLRAGLLFFVSGWKMKGSNNE